MRKLLVDITRRLLSLPLISEVVPSEIDFNWVSDTQVSCCLDCRDDIRKGIKE